MKHLFLFSDVLKNTFEGHRLVCSTNTLFSCSIFLFLYKQEWILEKIISSQELICSLIVSKVFVLKSLFLSADHAVRFGIELASRKWAIALNLFLSNCPSCVSHTGNKLGSCLRTEVINPVVFRTFFCSSFSMTIFLFLLV